MTGDDLAPLKSVGETVRYIQATDNYSVVVQPPFNVGIMPVFQCSYQNPVTKELCKTSCTRAWNLKRHISSKHKPLQCPSSSHITASSSAFEVPHVQLSPGSLGPGLTSRDFSQARQGNPALHWWPPSTISHPTVFLTNPVHQDDYHHDDIPEINAVQATEHVPTSRHNSVEPLTTIELQTKNANGKRSRTPLLSDDNPCVSTYALEAGNASETIVQDQVPRKAKKRKYLGKSFCKNSMPVYEVKQSKKNSGQQQAIEWLGKAARSCFKEHYINILARWGVKDTHQGACILCPADWGSLEPLAIMELFRFEASPLSLSDSLVGYFLSLLHTMLRYRSYIDIQTIPPVFPALLRGSPEGEAA